jgi:hypothetical protein
MTSVRAGDTKAGRPAFALTSWLLAGVAAILFAANFLLHYPGEMNNDAVQQYAEALSSDFTDWHPPMMAFLWSLFIKVIEGPGLMLAFHLLCHWFAFALIADALSRTGHGRLGLLTLFAGAFPVLLHYNGGMLKDVGMGETLLAAFSVAFWFHVQQRRMPVAAIVLALLLATYGLLVRTNAVFAFGAIVFFVLFGARTQGLLRVVVVSCVLAVIALPVSGWVNHHLFKARNSGAIQSLQIFDLVGIARHSGDLSVLPPPVAMSGDEIKRCYTPFYWDTLSPWGICRHVSEHMGAPDSAVRQQISRAWVQGILAHPWAYAEHRFKVANSIFYFLVPARHCRYAPGCGAVDTTTHYVPPSTPRDIRIDYLKKNFLVWPMTWFAFGIAGLVLAGSARASVPRIKAARVLLVSGLLYMMAFSLIGVASDVRYAYWTIMSVLLALLLLAPEFKLAVAGRRRSVVLALCIPAFVVAAGLTARLVDMTWFLS